MFCFRGGGGELPQLLLHSYLVLNLFFKHCQTVLTQMSVKKGAERERERESQRSKLLSIIHHSWCNVTRKQYGWNYSQHFVLMTHTNQAS